MQSMGRSCSPVEQHTVLQEEVVLPGRCQSLGAPCALARLGGLNGPGGLGGLAMQGKGSEAKFPAGLNLLMFRMRCRAGMPDCYSYLTTSHLGRELGQSSTTLLDVLRSRDVE